MCYINIRFEIIIEIGFEFRIGIEFRVLIEIRVTITILFGFGIKIHYRMCTIRSRATSCRPEITALGIKAST